MFVRLQSDLENTKEGILPVCDKPYHQNKRKVQKGGIWKLKFCRNVHYRKLQLCFTSNVQQQR